MTADDFAKTRNFRGLPERRIIGDDLKNQEDRTLLYGYTCERDTWHVYLYDGVIHVVKYGYKEPLVEMHPATNEAFVPDKRLYPERCDFEFCKLLADYDVYLPFTTFDEKVYNETKDDSFHGYIL
jgi:hypothetical protein